MKYLTVLILGVTLWAPALGQVTYQRLLESDNEPGNWLTYSGNYNGQRYSRLEQINQQNVQELEFKWAYQMRSLEDVETTPLVVDGIMYLTEPPSNAHALDPRTGRTYWSYIRDLPDGIHTCCGRNNRGLAMLGDTLYLGTVDAHLVALDAKTGSVIWDIEVADRHAGYSLTLAPLVVKDKVIVGVAGGEFGIRGFLDAYDAETGKRVWRFYTVPGPGEPGHESWEGEAWKTGGAPTWITGSFDPDLNLVYWGTGNPSPDFNGAARPGDNLYADSVIALDADSGRLKWYFQFTPHDVWDWDAAQIPVLVDAQFQGQMRKLMLWPNRNAFYYVFDRATGELLLARQFARQTWAQGIDSKGRPVIKPEAIPTDKGVVVFPGIQGATNWYSPSYSPLTGLLYIAVRDVPTFLSASDVDYDPGGLYLGSRWNGLSDEPSWANIRALIPQTGQVKWEYPLHRDVWTGLMSTAGGLVFGGSVEGQIFALDTSTGKELWRSNIGGKVISAPVTYLSDGKQLVSIAAGNALFTFGLHHKDTE